MKSLAPLWRAWNVFYYERACAHIPYTFGVTSPDMAHAVLMREFWRAKR